MKRLWNMLAGLLVLGAAGCGLSDYQSRMDAQRARVKKFDDANELLGDPIDIPTMPGKGLRAESQPAWPFDFYLRIPKGYVREKEPYYTNFPFYRYAGTEPGYSVFVAAAVLIDKDAKERYGEYSVARFRELVRLGIDHFYFKNYKSDPRFYADKLKLFLPSDKIEYSALAADLITPFSDVAEKIPYAYTSFKDTANRGNDKPVEFRVYFHDEYGKEILDEAGKRKMLPGKQVAIVAQAPIRGQNEQFDTSIQAALGTLDLSAEVANKRAQYKRLKGS
jgi:hypothetical protein